MAFEAYSVAIKLSLTNMVSSGLQLIAKDLTGLEKNVVNLQDKFTALKMIGVGWGMKHIGDGMLGFLGKTVETSKEYTRQLSLMNAAGMSHLEIAKATSSAWATSKEVITSSASQNMTAIRELRSVFGKDHMDEAYAVLPQVQRTKAIMEALTGKEQHGVAFDMVKAIELGTKGAVTKESLLKQSEMMSKALMQFGGTLTVQDFHQALKYSRAAAPYMSDDFKYKYLPTLIQEMKTGHGGASSAGNVIASMYALVAGRQIPKELIANWQDAGLLKKGSVVADKHNRTTSKILPGGILGSDEFAENPYTWAQKYVAPAIKHLMATKHLSETDAFYALTKDRMKAFGLQTLVNKAAQFERDRKLIESGPSSYESYQRLLKTNPQLAQQALHSQWENVQARIGYEILPKLIPLAIKFADWLGGLAQWMEHHPNKLQALVIGFGTLGIGLDLLGRGLMAAGIIKLLGLGPMIASVFSGIGAALMFVGRALFLNPIGITITGIGVAAYLLWKNWDTVKPKLLAVWNWITDNMAALWSGIKSGFHTFVGWYLQGWQTLFNLLISGLNKILPTAMQISKMHFADDWNTPKASYSNEGRGYQPAVPGRSAQPLQVTTQINLDGRKIGEAVSKYQGRELNKPPSGTMGPDPSVTATYAPTLARAGY
ncbi:hypothetical protein [Aquitalea magnusonii]|uniref:Uncharacterized protein n=1 Tax=Aquitalea magnusonii TaxID=332411 RepID=A0A318J514_9NEIS|nr:hypothetical protein [Aquitalea magnusonii]PXX42211.1 hypothetical protein DFR38_1208 [Aquitalea magnusonii]